MKQLSVIIASYNDAGLLVKCLKSIRSQIYDQSKIEILVVDGGSTDNTKQIVANFKGIFLAENSHSPEAAKSIAFKYASGELIFEVDCDNILPHKQWLAEMVHIFDIEPTISGCYPWRYTYRKKDKILNRYFSLFGVNDPVAYFLNKADTDIVAFIDDDVYTDKTWLKNAISHFGDPWVAAVCGPGITPSSDSLKQQVSGWVWSSWFGAGGAGTYRCLPASQRNVDDYPTFNLLVRRSDFNAVGGFNTSFWPGEDTVLCHNLVCTLNKKIKYDPNVVVFHHRRPVFTSHLQQLSRYGIHRGYFAKILPSTSRKVGYFIPMLFVSALILLFTATITAVIFQADFTTKYLLVIITGLLSIYLLFLTINALWIWKKSNDVRIALLSLPAVFFTHVVYGLSFIYGLIVPTIKH